MLGTWTFYFFHIQNYALKYFLPGFITFYLFCSVSLEIDTFLIHFWDFLTFILWVLHPIPPPASPRGCPPKPLSRVRHDFSHWGQTRQSSAMYLWGGVRMGGQTIPCVLPSWWLNVWEILGVWISLETAGLPMRAPTSTSSSLSLIQWQGPCLQSNCWVLASASVSVSYLLGLSEDSTARLLSLGTP